jgi:thymidylate synthase
VATLLEYDTGRRSYAYVAAIVMHDGRKRSPRGMATYDLGPTTIVLESPYDALPIGVGRKLKFAIGAAEAVQLVAGRSDHALLPRIAPAFKQFVEPDTGRFHGAYGDRIGQQVEHVIRKISADRDTRQAVITLWNPALDNVSTARDFPCTVALNFAVIDDKLEMRTQMRSNDVWLGYPYDIFMFTQLQLTVARAIQLEPGPYTHSTWSLHLYERDVPGVEELTVPTHVRGHEPYQPAGFGLPGETWDQCRRAASRILENRPLDGSRARTDSEEWYVKQLAPHQAA